MVTNITDGTSNAYPAGITVSGNDVYIVGSEYAGAIRVSKYWKNGVAVNIPVSVVQNALFYDIAVSGPDVYVAGNEYSVTGSKAVIYKNGTPIWLTTVAPSANAWGGIAISGTDVYAGGNGYNAAGTMYVALLLVAVVRDLPAGGKMGSETPSTIRIKPLLPQAFL